MERIVLAYDASAAAESARQWVEWRTDGNDAVVDILLVNNPLWADKTQAQSHLRDARDRLRRNNPRSIVHAIERDGRKVPNLVRGAREADLVVMGVTRPGSDARSSNARLPLRVGNELTCPTCLVPEGWARGGGRSRVVVGVDDDDSSDTAIAYAADEATRLGIALHLVHAWKTMPALPTHRDDVLFGMSDVEAAHRRLFDDVVARVRAGWPTLSLELTMVHDNPVSTLTVASSHACLAVIGSHRRGVLAAGFSGSVARDVTRDLRTPLCIVP
ncbi:nucleotide-binding universal stress UspA family protein [Microbacterium proteolyticum]|uniref:Nucleotide-binding universal stress UspA family protein n=1 Tax=Microbacterium proteolyticum TaxID=1572644 RepID=A0A7W5CIH9_9MICO|nr:universal stress protein [Microbacterium proteolyticum]MBB3158323.1 nucleotide-binding universal stress UspA family protein [Microbacterium proteolyticum]